jgi:1,4-alpha-glucan branching enzyme
MMGTNDPASAPGGPGLGATAHADGVTFRVWAPDAQSVAVTGDFCAWSPGGIPLTAGADGVWTADVASAAAGQAYQYLIGTQGGTLTRVDPLARLVVSDSNGTATRAVVYDEGVFDWGPATWSAPGWTEMIVYELHVGSFGRTASESVGTLADATAMLPYLHDLGINAVELLPLASFEGSISWGYNPGVPYSVEGPYGGPDGLKSFVRAAHEAGIAVILDVVYNHLGPADSILWQFDGSGPTWEGGIYFYGSRYPGDPRPQTPWGSRPDYGRPEVRRYLVDNALAWLQDYRLDGLRLDATAYVRNSGGDGDPSLDIPDGWLLLQELNDRVDAAQPWKLVVAEDMQGNDWITRPTRAMGAAFDSQWDAAFLQQVRSVLEVVDDADRDMGAIQASLERRLGASATSRVVFTESHDADGNGRTRVPTEIDPAQPDSWWAKKRSTLGGVLVLTAPGIPLMFQGQEFLEQQPFVQDPAPLDWGNVEKYAGILQLYRDLIHLRRDWHATTRGLRGEGLKVFHRNDSAKVVAYHRYDQGGPGDDVVVVLNLSAVGLASYLLGLPRGGTWRVRFNSDWSGYDPGFGDWPSFDCQAAPEPRDGFGFTGSLGIGPYTALILSQDG